MGGEGMPTDSGRGWGRGAPLHRGAHGMTEQWKRVNQSTGYER